MADPRKTLAFLQEYPPLPTLLTLPCWYRGDSPGRSCPMGAAWP